MSKVTRFEDLRCWMSARELVKLVYSLADTGKLSKDYATKDQLKRAALSVMNNIAEGFGRFSNREFIRYLEISQSPATEVLSISYVLEDLELLPESDIEQIRSKTEEARVLTLALIKYLKNKGAPSKQ